MAGATRRTHATASPRSRSRRRVKTARRACLTKEPQRRARLTEGRAPAGITVLLFAEDHHVPGEPLVSLPSVTRLSGAWPDPWLCVPASRRVCPYREGVSASINAKEQTQPTCHKVKS